MWMIGSGKYFFKGLFYFVLHIEYNKKQKQGCDLHQEYRATLLWECFPLLPDMRNAFIRVYVVCDCKLKRLQFHSTKGNF